MKIIKRPKEDWWIGEQVHCECGTVFEMEIGDNVEISKWTNTDGTGFWVAEASCLTCNKIVRFKSTKGRMPDADIVVHI